MRRPQKFGPSSTLFLTLHKCKMDQIWIASWEYLNFVEKNRNLSSTTPHCTVQYDFCITDVFFRLLQLLYNYFMLPLEFWFWCDKSDMIVNFPELWPNLCNAKKIYSGICKKNFRFFNFNFENWNQVLIYWHGLFLSLWVFMTSAAYFPWSLFGLISSDL